MHIGCHRCVTAASPPCHRRVTAERRPGPSGGQRGGVNQRWRSTLRPTLAWSCTPRAAACSGSWTPTHSPSRRYCWMTDFGQFFTGTPYAVSRARFPSARRCPHAVIEDDRPAAQLVIFGRVVERPPAVPLRDGYCPAALDSIAFVVQITVLISQSNRRNGTIPPTRSPRGGPGNNRAVSTATASSFLNAAGTMGGCRSVSGSRQVGGSGES